MITTAGSDRSFFVAKLIAEFFPSEIDFAKLKVLDLAAGTGVLGPHLSKMGFKKIDALGKFKFTKLQSEPGYIQKSCLFKSYLKIFQS